MLRNSLTLQSPDNKTASFPCKPRRTTSSICFLNKKNSQDKEKDKHEVQVLEEVDLVWFELGRNSETYRSVQNYELQSEVKQRHGRLGEPEPPHVNTLL